ncbi:hypothetical protein JTB14_010201 [Gonioctena quinquepunctata]|nr:hypothetical protein JTB14_010201 [Gonioctena quinquepunctata]
MNCSERITTYSHEYSNICQVCLGKTELGSFQEENLMKLFLNITNIDVSKNKCPCKICKNCLNELIGISVFIEVAHSNEATLKQGSTDNADNICRVCLSGSNLVPFGNDLLFPLLQSISDSKICCNINFPSNICTKCKQKLKQISDFIELSKKNQSSLEQSYFNKNIKTESCEMEASKNIEDETNNENRNGVSSEGNISSFEKSTLPDRIDLETIKKEQDLDVQATANVKGVKIETDKNSARDHRSEGHTVFSDEIKLESPEIEDIDMENGLIFTCNSCKKDFSSYREGNDYIGEYPAPCNSCGKWFVEKQEIPNSDDEIHIKQEHAFVDEDSKYMKNTILLVCVAAVFAVAHGKLVVGGKFQEAHEQCQANPSTHIEESMMQDAFKGKKENVDKAAFGSHMRCIYTKRGLLKENGDVDKEAMRNTLSGILVDNTLLEKVVGDCSQQKSTPEETGIAIFDCLSDAMRHFRPPPPPKN